MCRLDQHKVWRYLGIYILSGTSLQCEMLTKIAVAGCDDNQNMQQLSTHCLDKGCSLEECGLEANLPTPWLCATVVPVGIFV